MPPLPAPLRFAVPGDAELLSALGRTTFVEAFAEDPRNRPADMEAYMREAFSVERLQRELNEGSVVFLVAEVNGEALGYAKLQRHTRLPCVVAENPIELSRLYVRTRALGTGLGATLMQACLDEGSARGHDVLWLGVWEFNLRAIAFYARWGFERVGEHVFQLGNDPQIDWVFQRALGPPSK